MVLLVAHQPLDDYHTLNKEVENSDWSEGSVENNKVVTTTTVHTTIMVDHPQDDVGQEV